jgi:hypothetical protein
MADSGDVTGSTSEASPSDVDLQVGGLEIAADDKKTVASSGMSVSVVRSRE